MKLFKSFIACFSTYSRIPLPSVNLDSEDMKYSLIFFPFIGLVIGFFEYGLFLITQELCLPAFFRAVITALIPVIITGGIHIDGFMDTMDAFSSYGDREKKLAIMKDPNAGAFSVIYFLVYFLAFIAFSYLLKKETMICFCSVFVVSRIMSGISVVSIDSARKSGMLSTLKQKSERKTVLVTLIIMLIIVCGILAYSDLIFAIVTLITSLLGYALYKRKVIKEIGGVTGDTSGYYLCMMELILLVFSVLGGIL